MVSAEYASVLDGVSVPRIIWFGDWRHVRSAVESVKKGWPRIVVLQQYSTDGWPQSRVTDSFIKEMYRIAGKLPLFGRLPLTFDRRSPERESALVACLSTALPIILLATSGISSPFPYGKDLIDLLERTFPDVLVLDMDCIHGERIYDLLALFERVACLITVDSALLHLAQAIPQLPVVDLIADHPSAWHGSPAYAGQRLRVRYRDYPKRAAEIVAAARACLRSAPALGGRSAPTRCCTPKLGA